MHRFQSNQPLDERVILIVFSLVGIEPRQGLDYDRAAPILIPQAPVRPFGSYVKRPRLEERLLDLIELKIEDSSSTQGLLLSLEGEGGAGKTRLALEIMRQVANVGFRTRFLSFEHIVVETGPNMEDRSYDAFLELMAETLHLGLADHGEESVCHYLAEQATLLVLDNLETVMCPRVGLALHRIAGNCPGLALLCTSRLPVGVAPANCFDLEKGMEREEAVRLLQVRMAELLPADAPARKLPPIELREFVELCCYVPLAIENLAAMARTPLQPRRVAEELRKIASGMPEAIDVVGHFRNPLSTNRNRAMESSCGWGYRQIERWAGADAADIQRAYRICGVFAGPFTNEDFEAVAGKRQSRWLAELQSAHVLGADPELGVWTQNVFRRGFANRLLQESGEAEEIQARFIDRFFGLPLQLGARLGEPKSTRELVRRSQPNWIHACYLLAERIVQGDIEAACVFHEARSAIQTSARLLHWDALPLLKLVEARSQKIGATARRSKAI